MFTLQRARVHTGRAVSTDKNDAKVRKTSSNELLVVGDDSECCCNVIQCSIDSAGQGYHVSTPALHQQRQLTTPINAALRSITEVSSRDKCHTSSVPTAVHWPDGLNR